MGLESRSTTKWQTRNMVQMYFDRLLLYSSMYFGNTPLDDLSKQCVIKQE